MTRPLDTEIRPPASSRPHAPSPCFVSRRWIPVLVAPAVRILLVMVLIMSVAISAVVIEAAGRHPARVPVLGTVVPGQRPIRVLLVGDSMAGTLGVGLAEAASAAGVTLINAATTGCGVAIAWDGGWASSILTPGPPTEPCQSAGQLTAYWEGLLDRYGPDAVVYVNRMDTVSQEVTPGSSARMTSLLDPRFQVYLARALNQAVDVLASTGARVILATSVPTSIGLKGNANDDPLRWSVYDSLLRSVAAGSSTRAAVFDLGRYFGGAGPAPKFELRSPNGVQWRCRDGLHFTAAGGVMVASDLFRTARQAVASKPKPGAGPTSAPPPSPGPVPATIANQPWGPFQAQKVAMGCVA
jgi:hypothetical protein